MTEGTAGTWRVRTVDGAEVRLRSGRDIALCAPWSGDDDESTAVLTLVRRAPAARRTGVQWVVAAVVAVWLFILFALAGGLSE